MQSRVQSSKPFFTEPLLDIFLPASYSMVAKLIGLVEGRESEAEQKNKYAEAGPWVVSHQPSKPDTKPGPEAKNNYGRNKNGHQRRVVEPIRITYNYAKPLNICTPFDS